MPDHETLIAGGQGVLLFVSYRIVDERWASWIAWQLESKGYRVILQAWDFVPGTNFVELMDRGLADSAVVIAVLSRSYLTSRFTRLEWQSALMTETGEDGGKLIPVRVEDCPVEGLLSAVTYVDLVGIEDEDEARSRLLGRVSSTLAERAKPGVPPAFPPAFPPSGTGPAAAGDYPDLRGTGSRRPAVAPAYPPARAEDSPPAGGLSVLHVPGPRFGRGLPEPGVPATAEDLRSRIWADVNRLVDAGAPAPDLLVVSGDLTESGGRNEFREAAAFLAGLRGALGLEVGRCVIVPGSHDITRAMCESYFAECEADDMAPRPPYWPKWRHFSRTFGDFYRDVEGVVFDIAQPWTLFEIRGLRTVVAGLNSTMAESHRPEDRYGSVGEAQAAWFAERLRQYAAEGWLRLGAVAHDPAVLDDAHATADLLGCRLNLLLHGASGDGQPAAGPDGDEGMLTVPAGRAGEHEILHLTAGGLTRWRAAGGQDSGVPPAERTAHAWRSAAAAFPSSSGAPPSAERPGGGGEPADGGGRDPGAERGRSPATLLLDRIAEVVEAGNPGAQIRRITAYGPPHLLVTHSQDGFTRQWRVAAHPGEVTREAVGEFAAALHSGEAEEGAELVCTGPRPSQPLRDEALRQGIRVRSFTEFQGLVDLRDYVNRQAGRLESDQRYPPTLYVPQRFRELEASGGRPAGDDLVGEMLSELAADSGRFVLVLADFGRGKTFALRELVRRIPEELPHLTPVYVELRELDKAHSVEGLVAAHLATHGEERIDLKAFRYMLAQGRIALLFDGFDELATRVTFDRAADHLRTLLSAADGKAKIVVASRTQHFKSDAQVFTALGEQVSLVPGRRVLGIEDFGESQIHAYLRNLYSDEYRASERLRLIREVGNLLGLASNPRMLSFITRLDSERLRNATEAGRTLSGADLYREILDAWLRYEHGRTHLPGAPAGLSLDELWRAVTMLATRMAESGQTLIRAEELTAETGLSLAGLASDRLSPEEGAYAIGSGSLLVRDEEGMFEFLHSSVAEWLVANEIAGRLAARPDDGEPAVLDQRPLSQLTVDFLCDLADPLVLRRWMSRVLEDLRAPGAARTNALRVSARLRVPERADLSGALLQGEDLSQRNFSGVDFTGADLTRAGLVGSNLSRAVLSGARLRRARLDGARLDGADLTGADLGGARLTRTDLTGARLGGSAWNRAALIDVTGLPPGAAELPELRGAAIAPGQPVGTEIAPAVVGVPHGYHHQTARLPQPLAYSPDGGLLAVGHGDGGVSLCDTAAGLPVRTLRGHGGRVYGVSYADGGRTLVTAASDATIRLWDTGTGACAGTIEVPDPGAWPVQVSPDGRHLAYGAPDGIVRLLDIAGGRTRLELPDHASLIYTVAFGTVPGQSGDEQVVLTGDKEGVIRIWDLETGAQRARFTIPGGEVYRLRACPGLAGGDPERATAFAVGGANGTLLLLDSRGFVTADLAGHAGAVYALAFHPGQRLLASGCTDGGIRLWDLAAQAQRAVLRPHPDSLYGLSFSPDGDLLASASRDGLVRITSVADGQVRQELPSHKSAVWRPFFSPDGTQLATSSNDGTCRLWDVASGQSQHVLRGHGRQVTSVTFSSDGALLAAGGNDGVVRVWDPVTGLQRHALTGTGDRLVSAVFGPVPDLLAAASNDGGVYLWNAATGVQEREMRADTERVWAETFSPDGTMLATANDDDTVRLWYRSTGGNALTITDHKGRVRSLSFNPPGTLLATGCDDHGVRVWDAGSGALHAAMAGHADRVYSVAFSPDGGLLASAGIDGTAFLWDPDTGERVRRIAPGAGRLWTTAFSPDGGVLATAGDDGVIRLWSVSDGTALRALTGHADRVSAIAFSPGGALLASAADDGTVRVWDLREPSGPALRMTLLGADAGWAAFSEDGRYKFEGEITGQFWHVIGACRFEPGELDPYLPGIRRLPGGAPF